MTLYERLHSNDAQYDRPTVDIPRVLAALYAAGFDTQVVPSAELLAQEQELSEYVASLADLFYGDKDGLKYA